MSKGCVGKIISGHNEAGKREVTQLWNPSDSGVTLTLNQFDVAYTSSPVVGHLGADLCMTNSPLSENVANGTSYTDLSSSGGRPKAQIRRQTFDPAGLPSGYDGEPCYEIWMGTYGDTKRFKLSRPFVIAPGYGVIIRAAMPNSTSDPIYWLICNFEWDEDEVN